MNRRRKIKTGIDVAMAVVMILLFASRRTGMLAHMLLGILMLMLGLIHNLLNLSFWEHIGRGRYSRRRIILTVENVLLAVSMAAAVVSGFLFAPEFHRISALLFLILTVIHGGSHIRVFEKNLQSKTPT